MIIVFSGIWPYTKQLMRSACGSLPSTVSISRRIYLLWLDWLAKWSMVDIFVLVIQRTCRFQVSRRVAVAVDFIGFAGLYRVTVA
jgi:uncharacterized paraquat-inducible protein A